MARVSRAAAPKVASTATTGAYSHVRRLLEERFELHTFLFRDAPFGAQKQVDDVRAGCPVKVGARWLPPGAGAGAHVVIVHADDRVEATDDDWAAQWLAEEGL
jgi:hypothetical protein